MRPERDDFAKWGVKSETHRKEEATLESVQQHFEAMCDFERDTVKLDSLQEATIRVMDAIMK